MRNLILAGAAGLVLALTGTAAFAIPSTEQIMSHGQVQDLTAVGAFLPVSAQTDSVNLYVQAAPRQFGGQGASTGASVGGAGSHR